MRALNIVIVVVVVVVVVVDIVADLRRVCVEIAQ